MPTLFVASSGPLGGKTTIAAGIARKLADQRVHCTLERTGDDANAAADAALFARISSGGQVQISELAAGASLAGAGGRVVYVATPAEDPASITQAPALAGVIVNHAAPRKAGAIRAAYEAAGVKLLGVVPEDRLLASPTIGEVAEALSAEGENIAENRERPLDRPVIASIAADPGQTYFVRTDATAVIVRSDKPDLQLAALNAGPTCLIVTGGLPVLSYVRERVADEEIPLLRTKLDTKETVAAIEELFGAKPFSGGAEKLRRIGELLADVNVDALVERLGSKA
ncbi:MAG TPA: DRTGG domain-containing protein [Dehalococcoidia bacterium]|jgi:BioD-like phosphotransacetylase family protein|nr:DRTGG domain-containing protein [Dehalococcoidia bacterium]